MSMQDIHPQIHNDILFASILGVAFVVIVVAAIVLYFSFKKPKVLLSSDEIVKQYHSNELTSDQACAKLASVARTYVSRMSGEDIKTHTLGEISSLRLKWRNKKGADMLRQTIAALYPPEFANYKENKQAQNTTVDQAAEWVLVLLEGWQTKGQR